VNIETDQIYYVRSQGGNMEVGDKVVPKSKTLFARQDKSLDKSAAWQKAIAMGQPYLYVRKIENGYNDSLLTLYGYLNMTVYICSTTMETGGDYFIEEDLELYIKEPNIRVGDKVKILDTGGLYCTYVDFFSENNIPSEHPWREGYKCWRSPRNKTDPDTIYTIVHIGEHRESKETIYVLLDELSKEVYLMNNEHDGLLLVVDRISPDDFYNGVGIC
jgi:hypothetical protein